MKFLTSLNPTWGGQLRRESGEVLRFDCPVCPKLEGHRLTLAFKNPVDGGPAIPNMAHTRILDGTDFATLTIAPSAKFEDAKGREHWHGWIEKGRVFDLSESPIQLPREDGSVEALSPLASINFLNKAFFGDGR